MPHHAMMQRSLRKSCVGASAQVSPRVDECVDLHLSREFIKPENNRESEETYPNEPSCASCGVQSGR